MKQKPFLTEEDIKKLETRFKKIFLTKDDAKNFLTKEDLKNLLTKDDAKNFLTKEDLKNLSTKEDARKFATKFDLETFREDILFKMEELLTKFRNEMYEKIDPILIEKQISLPSTT